MSKSDYAYKAPAKNPFHIDEEAIKKFKEKFKNIKFPNSYENFEYGSYGSLAPKASVPQPEPCKHPENALYVSGYGTTGCYKCSCEDISI